MADIRESFPTLEDGTGAGTPASKSVAGDTATGKVGQTVFAFKDSSGNIVLPQLTSLGRIPVDTEAVAGTALNAAAIVSGSATEVTVATITLTVSTMYDEIMAHVTSQRDSLFRLVWNNNSVLTDLDYANTGSGQFSVIMGYKNLRITSGGTGTQQLLVKGTNENSLSDLKASITCIQST